MKKIDVENYEIVTNKNINKTICLISDIHHDKYSKKKFYDNLISKIKECNPDYIVIAGDVIDSGKVIENPDYRNLIEYFIMKLGSISKTIVTVGNHDLMYDYNHRNIEGRQLEWFTTLTKYDNVYYIYNESIIFNNLEFIHYTPSHQWFNNKKKDSFYNEFMRNPVKINKSSTYKILISHSPVSITKKSNYNKLIDIKNNINLILCGHMHNGVLPPFLEFLDYKHEGIGIIAPSKKMFPKYCRGIHKIDKTNIIISKGIRKINKPIILRILNVFYSSDITLIDLK